MNRISRTLGVVLVLAVPALAHAQEWSAEQEEVWATVEGLWDAYASEDMDRWYGYVDEDYRGWGPTTLLVTKADTRKWNEHTAKTSSVVLYTIKPAAIDIHGDVAIVFYRYQLLTADKDEKETQEMGRWADIYRKKNGRWLLISDLWLLRKTDD
jgi:ketosteroid isomerase-like protein